MKDRMGREIDYMRFSITDRCNLRCKYCMPEGIDCMPRWDVLSLEEFEAITPHTFRHTFATRSLEGNMKPKVLQKILGHATLQMTMDLYAHVLPDLQVDEMKLLEEEMAKVNGMADDMALKRFENTKDESGKIITLSAG